MELMARGCLIQVAARSAGAEGIGTRIPTGRTKMARWIDADADADADAEEADSHGDSARLRVLRGLSRPNDLVRWA